MSINSPSNHPRGHRSGAPVAPVLLALAMALALLLAVAAPGFVGAQQSPNDERPTNEVPTNQLSRDAAANDPGEAGEAVTETRSREIDGAESDDLRSLFGDDLCLVGECCPPSLQEWILIGLVFLVAMALGWVLVMPAFERLAIRGDRDAQAGRYLGLALAFLGALVLAAGTAYWLTECFAPLLYWVFGVAVIFAGIGLIYNLYRWAATSP